ncbi:3-hydroxyacyl-CoA dehydrogenase [Acidothermus cellulolyticus 11B]|jgi:3-hydroxybutyryl-CoA dehydrogenase|uniref:3-hydroxyacyl-CoA dehydrogenase n=1 Tax=Acidothermus cellulolyticus (strain ATCC 43068 / DSM 8971 / 11B) TaxID=351607 RepID=A0LSM1_ACIC1|nr:3-hydroxyacyl-CoA dehydrogenase family protein [Acidothermus cellulolyticus]ABK52431.1 3-hydroxyacyl-CoA dehydrogenase [Acidothermus cellulolyticus 11B]
MTEEQDIRTVGVVGSGLMGSGIAQVAAVAGYAVRLHDIEESALHRALTTIDESLHRLARKGKLSTSDVEAAKARITTTRRLADLADSDVVVEAVYEELDVKRVVFAELAAIVRPNVLLASNTTAIPITHIASGVSGPQRVVGMHFFSPVPVMQLCEIVRGLQTDDDTVARARRFAESLGKTCIVVNRDVAGFVTSRLLVAFVNEALRLVESGIATPEDIDTACRLGFGHAMGPLATLDLTGLDVIAHAAEAIYQATRDPKFAPPEILRRMVAAGLLGRKSGRGFYTYPANRDGTADQPASS